MTPSTNKGGLEGRVVLVTGGGRGIGAATAEHLASLGARVVISSRTVSQLDAVAARIRAEGRGEVLAVPADMGDPTSIEALFDEVARRLGPVDVLVCCAAVLRRALVQDVDLKSLDEALAVNVRGVYLCCQRAFAQMRGRGGAIITFSSLGGVRSTEKFPGMSAYVTSKAAVIGMTEALAVEGRPFGVRVNCVAPGAVDTEMLRAAAPSLRTSTLPKDIAPLCAFLADDAQSGSLTGAVLEVNSNE